MQKTSEIIINIPHASTVIPKDERQYFVTKELQREITVMTDHFTDDLFDVGEERLIFPVSRLVCDVERFRDDAKEIMSRKGMGAIYTSCHDHSRLRVMPEAHKEHLLKTYYDPYHKSFENMVQDRLDVFGHCLIIDGHSFPGIPLPYEIDQSKERPDICIGTDDFHTPGEMVDMLRVFFRKQGYTVALNAPFAGAIVPARYYRNNSNVQSLMIEINRGLYIDHQVRKKPQYEKIKTDIAGAIRMLKEDFLANRV
ncbi:MAG: N-formylglutamate amidohydrolase [Lachnospiraceae bacterium]|nr:N-formylglutamate amidohydrolase [Lachnospiraceae bacterium]